VAAPGPSTSARPTAPGTLASEPAPVPSAIPMDPLDGRR
jgi:hypothetical protein